MTKKSAKKTNGTSLVIVESPKKAETISKFLGKGYKVAASIGHIRDLPKGRKEMPAKYEKYKGESWYGLGVNVDKSQTAAACARDAENVDEQLLQEPASSAQERDFNRAPNRIAHAELL